LNSMTAFKKNPIGADGVERKERRYHI
jgi:hypothetical protein